MYRTRSHSKELYWDLLHEIAIYQSDGNVWIGIDKESVDHYHNAIINYCLYMYI